SIPRQSLRDGETVETVVGKTLVGRGTSSACKRSRSQPSYSIRARSLRRLHQTGRMYGSISPLNHHRLGAWQSGGVHVRPTSIPSRGGRWDRPPPLLPQLLVTGVL